MTAFAALAVLAVARDEVTDLIAKLRSTQEQVLRHQHADGIGSAAKAAHLPLLVKEVDAGPAWVRPYLIRALGEVDAKDVPAALKALAQRHEISSRAEAAWQLAKRYDEDGPRMLAAMLPKAENDEEKRTVISHLWGGFGEGTEASAALIAFLDREQREPLRRHALQSLASYTKDPAVLPALRKIAALETDPQRFDAVAELVRRGDEAALEQALAAVEAGGAGVSSTFSLLSAIARANQKSALPRLRAALEASTDRFLRAELIRTLADLKDDKALGAIAKLAEAEDETVAKAATQALIKLAGKEQIDLLKRASTAGDGLRRLDAAEALLRLDRVEGYEALRAELETGAKYNRSRAVSILGGVSRKESVDLLIPLIDDADASLAKQARSALVRVLDALFPYVQFKEDADAAKIRAWWAKHRSK